MTATTRPTVTVSTKSAWADAWSEVSGTALRPLTATWALAPAMSVATFADYHGSVLLPGAASVSSLSATDYLGKYVKIAYDSEEWVGVFVDESTTPYYAGATKQGVRQLVAYGMEFQLARTPCQNPEFYDSDSGVARQMHRFPPFNAGFFEGGSQVGNRSTTEPGALTYHVFSGDGAYWSYADVIESVLAWSLPATITWDVAWPSSAGSSNVFADMTAPVFTPEGLSLADLLNTLIDRRRGFSWSVRVISGVPTIVIQSAMSTSPDIGGSAVDMAPVNDLTVYNDTSLDRCDVQVIGANQYDTIRAQGARIKTVFSLSAADATLVRRWQTPDGSGTDEQTYYDAGVSDGAGYDDLPESEKAYQNDQYRGSDRFARVWTLYGPPADWDYMADGVPVAPIIDEDGEWEILQSAPVWPAFRRFLPQLPLREGLGYKTIPPAYWGALTAERRYLPPLVFVKGLDGRYRLADASADDGAPSAEVSVSDRDLAISVEFRPRHLLARNNWSTAEPSEWEPIYDWSDMVVTVAMETDQRLYCTSGGSSPVEFDRTKIINVPDAEYWIFAGNPAFGVDEDGALMYVAEDGVTDETGPGNPVTLGVDNVLRSDRAYLQNVADLAAAWYGNPRGTVNVRWKSLVALPNVGEMIRYVYEKSADADPLEPNAIVHEMAVDFQKSTTTVKAGWVEFDWARIAAWNRPGAPTTNVAGERVTRINSTLSQQISFGGEG